MWSFAKQLYRPSEAKENTIAATVNPDMFRNSYAGVFDGDERWNAVAIPQGDLYAWQDDSTYIKTRPTSMA